jgi:hypothetical protein
MKEYENDGFVVFCLVWRYHCNKIKKCVEGDFGFYPELLLTSTKNLVVQKKVRDKVGCKSSDIGLILYIVISMCIE